MGSSAIPTAYPPTKVALVGLKFVSIFNAFYFLQYLAHHPHRKLETISPHQNNNLPEQIICFHKAVSCMPTTFNDADSFISELEKDGHKQYILDTIQAYLCGLINLNNLYRWQLLPSVVLHTRHGTIAAVDALRGNQLVLFTYFKQILEVREQEFLSEGMDVSDDLDWRKFPFIIRKAGSGKTFTVEKCIEHCIHNDIPACVAVPTGILACTGLSMKIPWYVTLYIVPFSSNLMTMHLLTQIGLCHSTTSYS